MNEEKWLLSTETTVQQTHAAIRMCHFEIWETCTEYAMKKSHLLELESASYTPQKRKVFTTDSAANADPTRQQASLSES